MSTTSDRSLSLIKPDGQHVVMLSGGYFNHARVICGDSVALLG